MLFILLLLDGEFESEHRAVDATSDARFSSGTLVSDFRSMRLHDPRSLQPRHNCCKAQAPVEPWLETVWRGVCLNFSFGDDPDLCRSRCALKSAAFKMSVTLAQTGIPIDRSAADAQLELMLTNHQCNGKDASGGALIAGDETGLARPPSAPELVIFHAHGVQVTDGTDVIGRLISSINQKLQITTLRFSHGGTALMRSRNRRGSQFTHIRLPNDPLNGEKFSKNHSTVQSGKLRQQSAHSIGISLKVRSTHNNVKNCQNMFYLMMVNKTAVASARREPSFLYAP